MTIFPALKQKETITNRQNEKHKKLVCLVQRTGERVKKQNTLTNIQQHSTIDNELTTIRGDNTPEEISRTKSLSPILRTGENLHCTCGHLYERVDGHKQQSSSFCKHCLSKHSAKAPPCVSEQFYVLTKCSNKFNCLINEMLKR